MSQIFGTRAVGSGYYILQADGVDLTGDNAKHTTEREAESAAFTYQIAHPDKKITYRHDYIVEVTVTDDSSIETPPQPVSLKILGPTNLTVGTRGNYTATIIYNDASTQPVVAPEWTVDSSLLQSIPSTNQDFKAISAGTTTIKCSANGLTDTLTVVLEEADTVPIEPPVDSGTTTDPKVTVELLAEDDGHSVFESTVGYGFHPFKLGTAHGFIFHSKDGSVNVYNAYMDTMASITGTLIITAPDGTALVNKKLVPALGVGMGTQPRWYKKPVAKKPDADMLALLPRYAPGPVPSQYDYAKGRDYSPTGLGISSTGNQVATGERIDIGPLPGQVVPYILDPTEQNAQVVRWCSDSSAVWPIHFFDPATNKPVSRQDYPAASLDWYYLEHDWQGKKNPILHAPSGPYQVDNTAHLTHFGILSTLVFGTEYDKLELASWANFCQLWANPTYANSPIGDRLLTYGQTRARAWGTIQVAAAAKILGDAEFDRQVKASIAYANNHYLNAPGIVDHLHYPGSVPLNARIGFAPWQWHFFTMMLGYLMRLGYDTQKLIEKIGNEVIIPSMGIGSNVICYQRATSYWVQARATKDDPIATTYEDAYKINLAAKRWDDAAGCGHLFDSRQDYQAGDMDGYPWSDTGYPAIMKGALAACVDAGLPDSTAAWNLFISHERIKWNLWKYNIIPS